MNTSPDNLLDAQNRTRLLPLLNQEIIVSSFYPTDVVRTTSFPSAFIPAICEGSVLLAVNEITGAIIDLNVRQVPGVRPPENYSTALRAGTEVGVMSFTLTNDLIPTVADAPYSFGWFRISDHLRYGASNPPLPRYVASGRVEGCDELTQPLRFDSPEPFTSNLNQALPGFTSLNVNDIVCNRSRDALAREYCAAKMYLAFRATLGRDLTIRDVIRILLAAELTPGQSAAPPELLAATAANTYFGYCVGSSLRPAGCTFSDVLALLSTSDAWVQTALENGINQERLAGILEKFDEEDVVDNVPRGDRLDSPVTTPEGTPFAWGNYYFGTEGYIRFADGNDPSLIYCERRQGYDNRDAPNRQDKRPYEYLFVITDSATGNPETNYLAAQIGNPTWFSDLSEPDPEPSPCSVATGG